jgi:HEAT repeat protein
MPVLFDLAIAGFPVTSVDELRSKTLDYESVIPILIRWLPQVENLQLKASLIRALTVTWAKPEAATALLEEYRRADGQRSASVRWAAAKALTLVADDRIFDPLLELARDHNQGATRGLLVEALQNMQNPRAVSALVELLEDGEVAGNALRALGELRAKTARPQMERLLFHPSAWVRQEAVRALDRLQGKRAGWSATDYHHSSPLREPCQAGMRMAWSLLSPSRLVAYLAGAIHSRWPAADC